ncbi:DMT family transporter [Candidatus Woesearchaeota archaeon]|nr:DMT family transporter [Candidatus Woesearchaeota archaeon]
MNPLGLSMLAIVAAAFLWALEGVILTPNLFTLDVGFVVFGIHLATFVILAALFPKEIRHLKRFSQTDLLYLGLIALFGGAIGTIAIVKALFLVNFDHLSVIVLLQQLQPIFAIALAMLLLKERARPRFFVWAALALVAAYLLVFGLSLPHMGTGTDMMLAAGLALVAAASWGSATVFGRKVATRMDFSTAAFYRAGFTTLIMVLYLFVFRRYGQFAVAGPREWLFMTVIGLSSGVVAMLLYYYGLRRVKAMVATICELAMPVSAVALDYLIHGTVLSAWQGVGAVALTLSILRITTYQLEQQVAQAEKHL